MGGEERQGEVRLRANMFEGKEGGGGQGGSERDRDRGGGELGGVSSERWTSDPLTHTINLYCPRKDTSAAKRHTTS